MVGVNRLYLRRLWVLKPTVGKVSIGNLSVSEAQKSQLMAYVPQADEVDWDFPVSVFDVVMMGRYGYMNFLRIPSQKDRRLVMESLERVNLVDFRHRQIGELSGGQKKTSFSGKGFGTRG